MSDIAIRIENLGKQYRIGKLKKRYKTIRETIMDGVSRPLQHLRSGKPLPTQEGMIWALRDVSLEVNRGDVLGIIGHNGAGKSTLLKILSRITEPTEGRVELYGRVGSLLEVGTGFHQELTGRENIFLNGAIIGMKRAEVERKFDEIVEFSGIGRFLDTPVKRYSSGMHVRLAFAVAAHLEPEILLVDEVLAVGDAAFRRKCLGKMEDVARGGRTVLFVSHNMGAIGQLCERVVWLDSGQVVKMGHAPEVIHDYLDIHSSATGSWTNSLVYETEPAIKLCSASITSEKGGQTSTVRFDETITLVIYYEVLTRIQSWVLVFRLSDSSGTTIFTSWDTDYVDQEKPAEIGKYRAICHVPEKFLRPGIYAVTLATYAPNMGLLDYHDQVFHFEVSSVGHNLNLARQGIITPVFKWTIEGSD